MPLPPEPEARVAGGRAFEVRVVGARAISRAVRELTLERTDGAPFVFEAGQWVSLLLSGEAGELRRSYSLASAPNGTARFDIAVTHVEGGPGSSLLHALPEGSALTAVGPQGFFTRPPDGAPPSLFVATGTGVTPFRSLLQAARAKPPAEPIWLLFGARTADDLLYEREFAALAASGVLPHFRLIPTLSRAEGGWSGRRGYVQAHVRELMESLAALPASAGREPHAYICGLERMVGSVRELLRKEMGLPRQRVHTERYD